MTISWEASDFPEVGRFSLQDAATGTAIDVDMKA